MVVKSGCEMRDRRGRAADSPSPGRGDGLSGWSSGEEAMCCVVLACMHISIFRIPHLSLRSVGCDGLCEDDYSLTTTLFQNQAVLLIREGFLLTPFRPSLRWECWTSAWVNDATKAATR